jgi:hypothetical protein
VKRRILYKDSEIQNVLEIVEANKHIIKSMYNVITEDDEEISRIQDIDITNVLEEKDSDGAMQYLFNLKCYIDNKQVYIINSAIKYDPVNNLCSWNNTKGYYMEVISKEM